MILFHVGAKWIMQRLKRKISQSFIFVDASAVSRIAFLLVCIGLLPWKTTLLAQPEENTPWPVPVKTVAIIIEDDQGLPLKFPSSVFFDKTMNELYVVNGGMGRINLYGADYFPMISLGSGRGIDSPNGIFVADDGRLFICQGSTAKKPPRLTILNAAFFPLKEILVQQFPEAESFVPHRVNVGRNGTIYVTGIDFRGLMVLDSEGNFLHWLKPKDKLWTEQPQDFSKLPSELTGNGQMSEGGQPPFGENAETAEEEQHETEMANLPDYLKPKGKEVIEEEEAKRFGPVQVTDVACGSAGYIYILSEETSKVYVYNASEEFLFVFGNKGGSSGKMSRPRALAVDEKKKCVYVLDYMRHTILIYNFAGRFLFEIGGMGSSPGWFNFPTDLALNGDGNLIVADLFNQRVQVLDVRFEAGIALVGSSELSDKFNKDKLNKPSQE
ncbi:MAG: 6-bladed beta-propeller [Desulfobulbaceae bacterium]|nr:6-bladed beta-propeller [Desulfobulbaceae bacterium]